MLRDGDVRRAFNWRGVIYRSPQSELYDDAVILRFYLLLIDVARRRVR